MLSSAHAAELGQPVVRSHIGQPLVADIELTYLADPTVPVVVRLAHPDVYKGANIAMHPVLSNLNMSVMRRDGRQFLHVTSTREIDSQYVHLFLELHEGGKRNIRTETLWLTPDPNSAPPLTPPPEQAPLKADALSARAPVATPVAGLQSQAQPQTQTQPQPQPPPQQQQQQQRASAPRVLTLPPARSATATCPSAEQLKTCAETDYKNGLLSAQIVELEEKVKALELAMKGPSAAPASIAKAAAAAVAKTPPPPLPKTPAKTSQEKDQGFPWLIAGVIAGLLAIVGGAVLFVLRRRKKAKGVETAEDAAASSIAWYSRIAARLRRKKEEAAPVEPKLPDA